MAEPKETVFHAIDSVAEKICRMSDAIWDHPETAYRETFAARCQCELLKELGFQVETQLAGIPTAFSGRWGSGHPVIGILGEFDALSGMSQQACAAEKCPVVPGGDGHGCGHNLLGAGSIAAAAGIRAYLENGNFPGTVIYFGCPGEEGGSGKAFMARDGVFDELDAALTWHPMDYNAAWFDSTLANYQISYRFQGTAAHAAASPHLGRSALDAVELMNIGVQFLREHVIQEARIHYAITNPGGQSPNVVQPEAEVLYLIRAPRVTDVQDIYLRINNIAQGAALMTDTQVEIRFIKSCSNFLMNQVLADSIQRSLEAIGFPALTEEERQFAKSLRDTLPQCVNPMDALIPKLDIRDARWVREQPADPMTEFVVPRIRRESVLAGSTDVGDVSWVCPTGQVLTAAWPAGTPAHSWQAVSMGKSTVAHKAMLYAAKAIAATAVELLENPQLMEDAKAEHQIRCGGVKYSSPIPKEVSPAIPGLAQKA